jgi:Na+/melibiose symporter-like transporter
VCDGNDQCGAGKLTDMLKADISSGSSNNNNNSSSPPLRVFLRQLLSNRNFFLFVSVNFLQVGTTSFFSNFMLLILSALPWQTTTTTTGGSDGSVAAAGSWMMDAQSVGLAVSQLLPPLIVLALTQDGGGGLCGFGGSSAAVAASSSSSSSATAGGGGGVPDRVYRVVRSLVWFKVGLSALMLLFGNASSASSSWTPSGVLVFASYLFVTRALTTATFSFFTPVLSELIDEDFVTHRGSRGGLGGGAPMSSSFFGINALLTKPAQSIIPVLTVGLWTAYGYRKTDDVEAAPAADGAVASPAANPILSSPQAAQLQHVIFLCCTLGPLLTGLVQALLWRHYSLHGARLAQVKRRLAMLTAAPSNGGEDDAQECGLSHMQLQSFDANVSAAEDDDPELQQEQQQQSQLLLDKRRGVQSPLADL